MTEQTTAQKLCDEIQAQVVNGNDLPRSLGEIVIARPAEIKHSQPGDVVFLVTRDYLPDLDSQSNPGMLVTRKDSVEALKNQRPDLWKKTVIATCPDPYWALAVVTRLFAERLSFTSHVKPPTQKKIHPTAVVDPSAQIQEGVQIGPYCVVESGAVLGKGSILYPHCYIGVQAQLGESCVLFPGVKVYERSQIGSRVRIHANAVIGADGFGYAPRVEKGQPVKHEKIYHFGRAVIGNDVEIGAAAMIDRGTLGDTVVEDGAIIDNNVQIGHNVRLERGAVLCGSVGVAGSARVGRFSYVGGLTGISNKVYVGDGAKVGGCSLIDKDIPPGEIHFGNPQRPRMLHLRLRAMLDRMVEETRSSKTKTSGVETASSSASLRD